MDSDKTGSSMRSLLFGGIGSPTHRRAAVTYDAAAATTSGSSKKSSTPTEDTEAATKVVYAIDTVGSSGGRKQSTPRVGSPVPTSPSKRREDTMRRDSLGGSALDHQSPESIDQFVVVVNRLLSSLAPLGRKEGR